MPRVLREYLSYATASEVRLSYADNQVEGCKLCGEEEDGHGYAWHPIYEGHRWQEPTNEQRQLRIKNRRQNIAGRSVVFALMFIGVALMFIMLFVLFQSMTDSVRVGDGEEVQRVDAETQHTINRAHDVIVVLDDSKVLAPARPDADGTCLEYAYIVPARTIQSAAAAKYGKKPSLIAGMVRPIIENDIQGAYTYIRDNPDARIICVYSHDRRETDDYLAYAMSEVKDGFDDGTRVIGLPYHYGSVDYSVRTK